MHIYRSNAAVIVGRVIVDPAAGVAAGGVDGNLVFAVRDLAAAALLIDRTQNMKELADTRRFRIIRNRMCPRKSHAHERDIDDRSPGRPIAPIPRL